MSHTPLIGITTYHRDDQGVIRLPGEYADSVRRAGGVPLLLQPGESRFDVILDLIDGLILAGGGDVDPTLYGSNGHTEIYSVCAERDNFELELTQRVLEMRIPTMFICRGIQILNVALGGTLIPHIPDSVANAIDHRQPPDQPYGHVLHPVRVDENCRLTGIMQSASVTPASWHHQAVDKLASGLEVTATAADNIIEAVEMRSHPQVIAVQWHPELTAAEDQSQQRIFDELIRMAQAGSV